MATAGSTVNETRVSLDIEDDPLRSLRTGVHRVLDAKCETALQGCERRHDFLIPLQQLVLISVLRSVYPAGSLDTLREQLYQNGPVARFVSDSEHLPPLETKVLEVELRRARRHVCFRALIDDIAE